MKVVTISKNRKFGYKLGVAKGQGKMVIPSFISLDIEPYLKRCSLQPLRRLYLKIYPLQPLRRLCLKIYPPQSLRRLYLKRYPLQPLRRLYLKRKSDINNPIISSGSKHSLRSLLLCSLNSNSKSLISYKLFINSLLYFLIRYPPMGSSALNQILAFLKQVFFTTEACLYR